MSTGAGISRVPESALEALQWVLEALAVLEPGPGSIRLRVELTSIVVRIQASGGPRLELGC